MGMDFTIAVTRLSVESHDPDIAPDELASVIASIVNATRGAVAAAAASHPGVVLRLDDEIVSREQVRCRVHRTAYEAHLRRGVFAQHAESAGTTVEAGAQGYNPQPTAA